ncbi:MAG TPA: adenylate/guanylate cyclase domain-containing protein [Roseiflexaceae bacterium]
MTIPLQIAAAERAAFVQAARGELATDRLDLPPPPPPPTSAALLPGGTLTFLFTDIEGSTRLWEQQPDAMRAALARHDAILRDTIAAHGGQIFKRVGDAVCVAFATAPDALAAALDAQRRLAAEPWGLISPIQVRMALHTGAARQCDGDYFGPPLNRVARLRDSGHGGQVLLSAATWELVRDQLPPDVTLRDLGAHWLKGLSRPEPIYQLVVVDLPAVFPPLITLDRPVTNLPAQASTFIGREQQEQALHSLLRRPDVRLITLSGPGGTGKTRLAIEAAAALALTPTPLPRQRLLVTSMLVRRGRGEQRLSFPRRNGRQAKRRGRAGRGVRAFSLTASGSST